MAQTEYEQMRLIEWHSPDGRRVVFPFPGGQTALVCEGGNWEQIDARLRRKYEPPIPICSVCYSPDGTRIVARSVHDAAWVLDPITGQKLTALRGFMNQSSDKKETSFMQNATFSHDSMRVVTVSFDGTVVLWDVTTGQKVAVLRDARMMELHF